MKQLIKNMHILLFFVTLIVLIILISPCPANDYFQALAYKHQLLENIKGKKIILVGGSGVYHGYSAEAIENELPNYKVINMGFHGSLGIKYNINEIKPFIGMGDVVILVPEYANYMGNYDGDANLLKAISCYPKAREFIPKDQLWRLIKNGTLQFIQIKTQSYIDCLVLAIRQNSGPVSNKHGDIVTSEFVRDVSNTPYVFTYYEDDVMKCIEMLSEFNSYCVQRGARALLIFQAIPRPQYQRNKNVFDTLYHKILNNSKVPVIQSPKSSVYEADMFYDTITHLNNRGRKIRTEYLVGQLKSMLY